MAAMDIRTFLRAPAHPPYASAALLFMRLVVGTAFAIHGFGKIQNPFGWLPAEAPIHIPGFLLFLAAISEFGGGIAWILGVVTRIASLGIICTMSVAIYMHTMVTHDPFVSLKGGTSYELAICYLAVACVLLAVGPGLFSLDAIIFGRRAAGVV